MSTKDPFENYYYLGKIIKPHGYKGKVSAYLDTDEPEFYLDLKMLFLDIAGTSVPYFIQSMSLLNNKAIFELQDVDNLDKAELLSKKDIYLPLKDLPPLSGNQFYYHEVADFKVTDKNAGPIGTVKQVLEYPNQAVLQVFLEEKEILIPISDEIIHHVDRLNKLIEIEAPDGLIDIYLG